MYGVALKNVLNFLHPYMAHADNDFIAAYIKAHDAFKNVSNLLEKTELIDRVWSEEDVME